MATKKTTTTTTTKKKKTRKSVMSGHEKEFAELILKPKLLEILVAKKGRITVTDLAKVYNKKWDTNLSASGLKKYLDVLGWKYERVPMWTGIDPPSVPGTGLDTSDNVAGTPVDLGGHARDVLAAPDDEEAKPTSQPGTMGVTTPGQGAPANEFEKSVVG